MGNTEVKLEKLNANQQKDFISSLELSNNNLNKKLDDIKEDMLKFGQLDELVKDLSSVQSKLNINCVCVPKTIMFFSKEAQKKCFDSQLEYNKFIATTAVKGLNTMGLNSAVEEATQKINLNYKIIQENKKI